jgi:hypothetical protein
LRIHDALISVNKTQEAHSQPRLTKIKSPVGGAGNVATFPGAHGHP